MHNDADNSRAGEHERADEALVLHVLRVRGFVTPDGIAQSLGYFPDAVIAGLVDSGSVRHVEDRDCYSLRPIGRRRHEELLPTYADQAVQSGLTSLYDSFLKLNRRVKRLCTEWQLHNGTPNDHTDVDYDRACVDRLQQLSNEVRPILTAMADVVPRLARFRDRLDDAVAAVMGGETKRFTGVLCHSFHEIWMELHEDLIVLQRIDRIEEGSH